MMAETSASPAGGMTDDDDAIRLDEGLPAHEIHGGGYLFRRGASGARIVRLVATALILQIFSAGGAMARPLRHQHGKAARHQKGRERTIFRLWHLRPAQHLLRRCMRDHSELKRSLAGRTKQQ